MRTMLLALGLTGLVLAPGCKEKKSSAPVSEGTGQGAEAPPPDPAGGSASGAAGGSGAAGVSGDVSGAGGAATAPAGGSGATGERLGNKMAHCPSAVAGSETTVSQGTGGVVVTVTAKESAQVAEIQKRASHLDSVEASPEGPIAHTGRGTGGGRLGRCPVVMGGVSLAVEQRKDGVSITMTPKESGGISELARTARNRARAMAAGGDDESNSDLGLGEDEEPAEEE
jgi:hypothetical protein